MRTNIASFAQYTTAGIPKKPPTAIRFGQGYIAPNTNATSSGNSLSPRDSGVVMFALITGIPTVMYGFYKTCMYFAKRSERRSLNHAHDNMLARADAEYAAEQNAIRLNPVQRPPQALTHSERTV